jgi:hypothetical protein
MIYHIHGSALTRLLRSALSIREKQIPPDIAPDHGPDLGQLETNGADLTGSAATRIGAPLGRLARAVYRYLPEG